jgi:hypothetical protein
MKAENNRSEQKAGMNRFTKTTSKIVRSLPDDRTGRQLALIIRNSEDLILRVAMKAGFEKRN